MSAQLGALAFVESSLKERSHDAGLDGLPVCLGGLGQVLELGLGKLEHREIIKQVPVEVADPVFAE
jgi:hypothetical protein